MVCVCGRVLLLPAAILVPAGVRERHDCWLNEGLGNIVVTGSLDLNGHNLRDNGPNSQMGASSSLQLLVAVNNSGLWRARRRTFEYASERVWQQLEGGERAAEDIAFQKQQSTSD